MPSFSETVSISDIQVVGNKRAGCRHLVAAAQKVFRRTLDLTQMIKRKAGPIVSS